MSVDATIPLRPSTTPSPTRRRKTPNGIVTDVIEHSEPPPKRTKTVVNDSAVNTQVAAQAPTVESQPSATGQEQTSLAPVGNSEPPLKALLRRFHDVYLRERDVQISMIERRPEIVKLPEHDRRPMAHRVWIGIYEKWEKDVKSQNDIEATAYPWKEPTPVHLAQIIFNKTITKRVEEFGSVSDEQKLSILMNLVKTSLAKITGFRQRIDSEVVPIERGQEKSPSRHGSSPVGATASGTQSNPMDLTDGDTTTQSSSTIATPTTVSSTSPEQDQNKGKRKATFDNDKPAKRQRKTIASKCPQSSEVGKAATTRQSAAPDEPPAPEESPTPEDPPTPQEPPAPRQSLAEYEAEMIRVEALEAKAMQKAEEYGATKEWLYGLSMKTERFGKTEFHKVRATELASWIDGYLETGKGEGESNIARAALAWVQAGGHAHSRHTENAKQRRAREKREATAQRTAERAAAAALSRDV